MLSGVGAAGRPVSEVQIAAVPVQSVVVHPVVVAILSVVVVGFYFDFEALQFFGVVSFEFLVLMLRFLSAAPQFVAADNQFAVVAL